MNCQTFLLPSLQGQGSTPWGRIHQDENWFSRCVLMLQTLVRMESYNGAALSGTWNQTGNVCRPGETNRDRKKIKSEVFRWHLRNFELLLCKRRHLIYPFFNKHLNNKLKASELMNIWVRLSLPKKLIRWFTQKKLNYTLKKKKVHFAQCFTKQITKISTEGWRRKLESPKETQANT